MTPTPPARSFTDGAAALRFGLSFLADRRDLWPAALVPIALTLVLGFLGAGSGAYLGYTGAVRFIGPASGLGGLLALMLELLAALVAGVAGMLLGASLAVPLSGTALERIAAAARQHLGLPPPREGLRAGLAGFMTSMTTMVVTLGLGLAALGTLGLVTIFVPFLAIVTVPLHLAVVALLLTFDLGDHAFTLAGFSLGERLSWARANLGASLGFGLLAMGLSAFPFVGLVLLPGAVAGAAWLTAERR